MNVKDSMLSRNCSARPLRAVALLFIASLICLAKAQEPARTGPETEKRFPPLRVPPQFKATLFACDPLIEYPSVLALGPRSNSIFLAHDYMTGLGEKIVRRDEVRLVADTDGDGYADKSTVWATNFNSIQGLASHDGRVFVMHSPCKRCRHSGFVRILEGRQRSGEEPAGAPQTSIAARAGEGGNTVRGRE